MARKWKTQDGRALLPREMDNTHLLNTIKYMERTFIQRISKWTPGPDDGYHTDESGDEGWADHAAGRKVEDEYPIYPDMIAEAKRRELAVDRWCHACQSFHRPDQRDCDLLWCVSCSSYHARPVSKQHQEKLKCQENYDWD